MKKIMMFVVVVMTALVFMPNVFAEETTVNDATNLKTALESGQSVKLGENIELDATNADEFPIEIKTGSVTIDGDGHTISVINSTGDTSGNKTIITVMNGASATITNLTLKDSPKYGIQAFDGGKVTVDNVTIENCNYGAILVNGGDLTVKKLDMKNNGTEGKNGIEIGKAEDVTSTPKVTLDGTITSDNQNGYITVATNDDLKEFGVESTEESEEKLQVKDGHVVIIDKDGKVIAESNAKDGVTVEGETYVEPTPVTTTQVSETNPNTSDNANLYFVIALIGLVFAGITTRSLIRHN